MPVHDVTLSKSYYLQTTEVTQAQWRAVNMNAPRNDRPMEEVPWDWAQEFLKRLNRKEHDSRYRLPTEAEWEYACRAGGQEPDVAADPDDVAWWKGNAGNKTHPVGQKKPNAWGLYDMRGNVWEWVQDRLGPHSAEPQVDPQGPPSGGYRVVRGGSIWAPTPELLTCSCRWHLKQIDAWSPRAFAIGLRCARTP